MSLDVDFRACHARQKSNDLSVSVSTCPCMNCEACFHFKTYHGATGTYESERMLYISRVDFREVHRPGFGGKVIPF